MVSNDEIKKRLKEKREGLNSDDLYCPECGARNLGKATFCRDCGAKLIAPVTNKEVKTTKTNDFPKNHPKLAKIPGFRTGTGWKMIIGSLGYILIGLIIVFGLLIALINVDVATNVNSALYTDNIAGNNLNSSIFNYDNQYLLLNISVKNNGNGKVTIDPNDFSLFTNDQSLNSNVYIGNTSISSIEIAPGENKSMIIAFTIPKNETPNKLKYTSFWDIGSEGISADMGNIANQTPINGQYSFYTENGEYKWSGGSKSVEKTMNVSYQYLNEPFTTSYSKIISYYSNGSSSSFTYTENKSIKETTLMKVTKGESSFSALGGTLSIPTGTTIETLSTSLRDKNGVYMSLVISNPTLSYVGSNVTLVDSNGNEIGTHTVIRSQIIEIMGQKFDTWVIEEKDNTTDGTTTRYYDKTTGLLLKEEINMDKISGYDITYNGENVLTSTNVPLIGLKA